MNSRAYTVGALVAVAAALVLLLIAGRHDAASPAREDRQQPSAVVQPSKQPPRSHMPNRRDVVDLRQLRADGQLPTPALLRRRRDAQRAARNFLAGYLPLEAGNGDHAKRQLVLTSSTTRAERLILAAQPRVPVTLDAAPPAGRIVGMTGEFDKPPNAYACRALIDRDGTVTELGLTVVLRGGRWLVDALTE